MRYFILLNSMLHGWYPEISHSVLKIAVYTLVAETFLPIFSLLQELAAGIYKQKEYQTPGLKDTFKPQSNHCFRDAPRVSLCVSDHFPSPL